MRLCGAGDGIGSVALAPTAIASFCSADTGVDRRRVQSRYDRTPGAGTCEASSERSRLCGARAAAPARAAPGPTARPWSRRLAAPDPPLRRARCRNADPPARPGHFAGLAGSVARWLVGPAAERVGRAALGAESLYSQPLAPHTRRANALAVGDMYGVTGTGDLGGAPWRRWRRVLAAFLAGLDVEPTSFLRRAPRPNEIYYVVSPQGLSELVARAVARR